LKPIEIIGAVLVTPEGLRLAGELGIDKDIDIVAAMFNAMSSFVEDAFDSPADQIKLGSDLFITRVQGNHAVLWMTTTGVSEALTNGARELIQRMEREYLDILTDWDGMVSDDLIYDFKHLLKGLSSRLEAAEGELTEVPQLGFDILKSVEARDFIGPLEDAYNLYFISGDHDLALNLANEAARVLKEQNPADDQSSLFLALAAKVLIQTRENANKTEFLLGKALELAQEQENETALAETADAYSHFCQIRGDYEKAKEWSAKAKAHMENIQEDETRRLLRYINIELTEVLIYFFTDGFNEAIKRWKGVLNFLNEFSAPTGGIDQLGGFMIDKHKMSINNNVGFTLTLRNKFDARNYEEAIPYFEESLKNAEESRAIWYLPIVKSNLGLSYAFINEFGMAKDQLAGAYDIAHSINNPYRLAVVERSYGILYFQQGKHRRQRKDLYEAMHWFHTALERQASPGEMEYVNEFVSECERTLKSIL